MVRLPRGRSGCRLGPLVLNWHHSIALPNGQIIAGWKSLEVMKQQYDMTFGPLDLKGKSVLDLGTWSGAFAVEAARRGAAKVVGVDYVTWRPPFTYGREAFDFVVAASGFQIEGVELDLDATPLSLGHLGSFDIVLFLGVFYHLKDPIAAIREINKITRETLVIETYHALELAPKPPAMIFYPGRELANDPTNWWAPNISCVESLLTTFEFPRVVVTDGSAPNRKVFHAYKVSIS
jgi:tRNA (mo5U34)-methyltransferase